MAGGEGVGDVFQRETKYDPERLRRRREHWEPRPEAYKAYEAPGRVIRLPEPAAPPEKDLWVLLGRRRSRRVFDPGRGITMGQLSALLWAAQGVTARRGTFLLRTAPSAGALYPVETYLHAGSVEGLPPGIYHFRPQAFDLEQLRDRACPVELAGAALGQRMAGTAAVTFIWSAVIGRCRWKYRQRAYRYIYLDAGHIGQNLALAAEGFGLGCCMIGAFFDDPMNALIGVDGMEETALYLAAVGWPTGNGEED